MVEFSSYSDCEKNIRYSVRYYTSNMRLYIDIIHLVVLPLTEGRVARKEMVEIRLKHLIWHRICTVQTTSAAHLDSKVECIWNRKPISECEGFG